MLKHCSKRLARIDALHKTLPCVHASVALQTIATQIGHDLEGGLVDRWIVHKLVMILILQVDWWIVHNSLPNFAIMVMFSMTYSNGGTYIMQCFAHFCKRLPASDGQEQVCSGITRLVGWVFLTMPKVAKYIGIHTQENGC